MKCTQIRTWVIYVGCIISLNENVWFQEFRLNRKHFHMNSIFFFLFLFILKIYYIVVSRLLLLFFSTYIYRSIIMMTTTTYFHPFGNCMLLNLIYSETRGFPVLAKELKIYMQFYYVLELVVHQVHYKTCSFWRRYCFHM